ncbi:MAG: hypothetical protein M1819_004892 [Sarea resinae]|nr:MAG: hypothetical protein M1819_004892 [Sarea resinae]
MASLRTAHPLGSIDGEKNEGVESSASQVHSPIDMDEAYQYIREVDAGDATIDPEGDVGLKALRRKIDWRIVPIMFACYTMQFIDKVLINYAAVMGLTKDLKLKGNNFTDQATYFFVAYLLAEIINGSFLQKVPAAKWLGCNIILWGISTACTAATHTYRELLAVRIFLGIFEAAIAPSLMLISSQWYTKSEQAPRFAFWYCGLGLGQIIGGLISYAFQHVHHPSFTGWRIMFTALGCVTVVIGFIVLFFLPDTPMSSRFLTEKEKVRLIKHVSVNETGIENRQFKLSQVIEALFDIQIWLLILIVILVSISSGVVTTYSSTLIRGFGYKPPIAALLNMPSGAVSIISTLVCGFAIERTSHRWAWIVACCVPGIIGGGLMSYMHNQAGQLAGIYLVNAIVAPLTIIYQWTVANCAGHSKKVVATAAVAGSFSIGNIIGPQTFQAKDAPEYHPAKITVLATQAAAAFVSFVLFLYYVWCNKSRDRKHGLEIDAQERQYGNLTDKENTAFRYVY